MNNEFPHIRDIIKYTLEYNCTIDSIKEFLIKNQPKIGTDKDFPKVTFNDHIVKDHD